jgi:SsrA-binding protein
MALELSVKWRITSTANKSGGDPGNERDCYTAFMAKKKKTGSSGPSSTIALNKKARHDFFIEERFEAGLALQGWEVKSLREGRVQLAESYILIKNGEAWLLGSHITPLITASTHIKPDPTRTRKLLMHRRELDKLIGAVERKGYTLVPLALYWKKGRAKLEVALARGKQSHDKRATEKARDWEREKSRILRHH